MWPTEAHRTATRAICVHYLGYYNRSVQILHTGAGKVCLQGGGNRRAGGGENSGHFRLSEGEESPDKDRKSVV